MITEIKQINNTILHSIDGINTENIITFFKYTLLQDLSIANNQLNN